MKLNCIKNKNLKRFSEHAFYLAITFILIPAFIYFELCVVLPTFLNLWSLAFFIHYSFAVFLTFNIMGNMIYGMFTNTTIKSVNLEGYNKEGWTLCSVCECMIPPRAWHCDTCEICVLKRDHHCIYFTCCIGFFNHRYFMWYTFYVFVGMLYSFYFNIKYTFIFFTWNHGLTLVKFICPLASLVIDFGDESLYIFLVVINGIIGLFAGFIFIYHFNNILKGRLVPETKSYTKDFIHNKGWKLNLIEVFGNKWYLTWISPFIHSKLPGNGIEWAIKDKSKIY